MTSYFRNFEPVDAQEDYLERVDRHGLAIVKEFLNRNRSNAWTVSWNRIRKDRMAKIWLDYGKSGVVRDLKGMSAIAAQMLELIPRLDVCNAFCGHDTYDPLPMFLDETGHEQLPPTDRQEFLDGLCLVDGTWLVSDYGLPYLRKIHTQIFHAEPGADELCAVDKALNVIHQRGDIAAFFIEGGVTTLTRIANQGGYESPQKEEPEGHRLNEALANTRR